MTLPQLHMNILKIGDEVRGGKQEYRLDKFVLLGSTPFWDIGEDRSEILSLRSYFTLSPHSVLNSLHPLH